MAFFFEISQVFHVKQKSNQVSPLLKNEKVFDIPHCPAGQTSKGTVVKY